MGDLLHQICFSWCVNVYTTLGREIDPTIIVVIRTVRSLDSNKIVASKGRICVALCPCIGASQRLVAGEIQHDLEVQTHFVKVVCRDESTGSRIVGIELEL